jgi:hypothetical protein
MLHTAFRTNQPDAHPPRPADAGTLVATTRGALDREATGVVRACLDQLARLLATHRAGRHPARAAMAVPTAAPLAIRGGLATRQARRVCALAKDEHGRMIRLGARPMTSFQYLLELQRDRARGATSGSTTGIAKTRVGARSASPAPSRYSAHP